MQSTRRRAASGAMTNFFLGILYSLLAWDYFDDAIVRIEHSSDPAKVDLQVNLTIDRVKLKA